MFTNPDFIRAARGPLVLVVLGVLMQLQQMGQASFGQTWPVLVIVIGLLMLVERILVSNDKSASLGQTGEGGNV